MRSRGAFEGTALRIGIATITDCASRSHAIQGGHGRFVVERVDRGSGGTREETALRIGITTMGAQASGGRTNNGGLADLVVKVNGTSQRSTLRIIITAITNHTSDAHAAQGSLIQFILVQGGITSERAAGRVRITAVRRRTESSLASQTGHARFRVGERRTSKEATLRVRVTAVAIHTGLVLANQVGLVELVMHHVDGTAVSAALRVGIATIAVIANSSGANNQIHTRLRIRGTRSTRVCGTTIRVQIAAISIVTRSCATIRCGHTNFGMIQRFTRERIAALHNGVTTLHVGASRSSALNGTSRVLFETERNGTCVICAAARRITTLRVITVGSTTRQTASSSLEEPERAHIGVCQSIPARGTGGVGVTTIGRRASGLCTSNRAEVGLDVEVSGAAETGAFGIGHATVTSNTSCRSTSDSSLVGNIGKSAHRASERRAAIVDDTTISGRARSSLASDGSGAGLLMILGRASERRVTLRVGNATVAQSAGAGNAGGGSLVDLVSIRTNGANKTSADRVGHATIRILTRGSCTFDGGLTSLLGEEIIARKRTSGGASRIGITTVGIAAGDG